MRKAYQDRTPNMGYAAIGSRINLELAGNPSYKAIVDRMGFPQPVKGLGIPHAPPYAQ